MDEANEVKDSIVFENKYTVPTPESQSEPQPESVPQPEPQPVLLNKNKLIILKK